MSVFEVLARDDYEGGQARSRAIIAARVRAQEAFETYLGHSKSIVEYRDRLEMIRPDLEKILSSVATEYGHEDTDELQGEVLASLKYSCDDDCEGCDDCTDEDGKKKKKEFKPWEKEANKYIKHRDGKWVIIQKGTGKVLSSHDSEEKAQQSFDAMMANKHGSFDQWLEKTACDTCKCSSCDENCDGSCCDECARSKQSKTAAGPELGDSYQSETVDLPTADNTGLGSEGSPEIDKGNSGDETGWSTSPIDAKSVRNKLVNQNVADPADYNAADFDPDSKVRTRVNPDTAMQSEHNVAPNTKTWTGTEGQATPVTSKYEIVSLG